MFPNKVVTGIYLQGGNRYMRKMWSSTISITATTKETGIWDGVLVRKW